jgi:hypothetical protein
MGLGKTTKALMRSGSVVVSRQSAARLLGDVHTGTVNKWVREGHLERVFLGSRSMITTASIEKFIREGRNIAIARGKVSEPDNLRRAGFRTGSKSRGAKTPEFTPVL